MSILPDNTRDQRAKASGKDEDLVQTTVSDAFKDVQPSIRFSDRVFLNIVIKWAVSTDQVSCFFFIVQWNPLT